VTRRRALRVFLFVVALGLGLSAIRVARWRPLALTGDAPRDG
jgi:hypothetical protein